MNYSNTQGRQGGEFTSIPLKTAANNYSGKPVYSHKLVLLGDMGVGKTCISIRYAYGKFSNTHEATIGGCFLTKDEEMDDYIVKYEIWDTAGQERYHSLAQMYYKNAIAACVVFDITSSESFEKCQKWVEELNQKGQADTIITVVGNKVDLDGRQVSTEQAEAYCKSMGLSYYEVSAKKDQGIEKVFQDIAKRLPQESTNKKQKKQALQLSNNQQKQKASKVAALAERGRRRIMLFIVKYEQTKQKPLIFILSFLIPLNEIKINKVHSIQKSYQNKEYNLQMLLCQIKIIQYTDLNRTLKSLCKQQNV